MRKPGDRGPYRGGGSAAGGFTLIELLMTMLLIGILAGIAVPTYWRATRQAEAARVVADLHTVGGAVREYVVREGTYPPTGEVGQVPPGLGPFLPPGFSFDRPGIRYRYRRWANPGTAAWEERAGRGEPLVAVEVLSSDQEFLRALQALSMGRAVLPTPEGLTVVLE